MAKLDTAAAPVGLRGGQRQRTHPPPASVTLSAENAASRSRPVPDPCPAASGALRAAHGRPPVDSRRLPPSRLLDREVCRCVPMRDGHRPSTTTTQPVAAQPER
jgi:hypothetical protein